MTARMAVAERVQRLRDLSPGQMLDLLIRLDAKSPRAMDDAIEYMQAATVVVAEITGEEEPQRQAPAAPAPGDEVPPRAAEDDELCGSTAPPEAGDEAPWHCNAAKGHGWDQHATWGRRGILLASWPMASRSLPFRPRAAGVLAEGETAAAAGNVTELGAALREAGAR